MHGLLERTDGRYDRCDRVCSGEVWMSCLFFFNKSHPSLVDETSVEGVYDNRVPFGQKNPCLHLLFSKYLQIKRINVTKGPILGMEYSATLHSHYVCR